MHYRDVWIKHYGEIPKDEDNRSYEIHHIDGNRENNDISNLTCIPIQEHYDIHYRQKDWGACVLIAKRMSMPPDYISNIQQGAKRPGIGGVKKGTVPWNKGVRGYKLMLTEEGRQKKKAVRPLPKLPDSEVRIIKKQYADRVFISDKVGQISKNGKIMSYERLFSFHYAEKYRVSAAYIERIIKGKSRVDV